MFTVADVIALQEKVSNLQEVITAYEIMGLTGGDHDDFLASANEQLQLHKARLSQASKLSVVGNG